MSDKISIAYVVGMSIAGVLLLIALAFTGLMIYLIAATKDKYDRKDAKFGLGAGILVISVITLITTFTTWPTFDMKYHTYKVVGGKVTDINGRQLASDTKNGGSSINYAVQFGTDDTYRCDDTRCALIKPGDELYLNCIADWQLNGTDGYTCNFMSMKKNRTQ